MSESELFPERERSRSGGMASSSSSSASARVSNPIPSLPVSENPRIDLLKEMRGHEVAVTELNNLPPSRAVYQKNGNIFFRKNIKSAIAFEQKQVDLAKARLENLNAA